MPLSTPASHGYKNSSLLSNQVQFFWHSSRPDTPTIQSGDGPIIETLIKIVKQHTLFYFDTTNLYTVHNRLLSLVRWKLIETIGFGLNVHTIAYMPHILNALSK